MNEGENSGASVTPETRDASEKIFSVRDNSSASGSTFSVVENSASPNVQNKNSIADQMAAELALAEAEEEEGVLSVHESSKSKKKKEAEETIPIAPATGDSGEIETIKATGQDYANAFSLIDNGDKDKSVTVGSATGITAGKGKGKTGFFGRSRYNAEAAEEAKKRAEARRLAEAEAAAKAAAEQEAAAKAAAEQQAAALAEEERKRLEKEAAERDKPAQAAAKRAAKTAPAAAPAPAPAPVEQKPQAPDFFSRAMEQKGDIVLQPDAPARNGRGKILALAVIAIIVVGGIIAAMLMLGNKKTTDSGDKVQAFTENEYNDLEIMKVLLASNYELDRSSDPLYIEKSLNRLKAGSEQMTTFINDYSALKLTSYGGDYENRKNEALQNLNNSKEVIDKVIIDVELVVKAVNGDAAAEQEIRSSNRSKYIDFFEKSLNNKAQTDERYGIYESTCLVETRPTDPNTCVNLLSAYKETFHDYSLINATGIYLRTMGGEEVFSDKNNSVTQAKEVVWELRKDE